MLPFQRRGWGRSFFQWKGLGRLLRELLLLFPLFSHAQIANYVHIPTADILQYQLQKSRRTTAIAPFKRYGLRRIHAAKFISDDDPRHIWAWHVHPNEEYNAASQPLYELFRKNDFASLAIIDVDKGETEIVFWDKQYYRRIADDLRRMGFLMSNAPGKTNVLCFRKIESTVRVDITIWWNLYHVQVY